MELFLFSDVPKPWCRPTQAGSHSTNEERLNSSPVRGRTVLPRVKPFNQEFLPDKSRFGPSDRTKIRKLIVTAQSPNLGFILLELIREECETRNATS
uniref:Uncharacterized protein n=1 Tax=Timema douglasi TaxID=61478 RepID=A0A7R8Z9T3_TIMDO|nr:unnamed protein product [Timema douglasi]